MNTVTPREAMLWRPRGDEGGVECYLCNHHCRIAVGGFGVCGMRENRDGKLRTHAYGELIAAHVDPIEKKPLYHFLPGTASFSVAVMGCNFKCSFCQNWQISQISVRDGSAAEGFRMRPKDVVETALAQHCRSISYTYTEPTIFFEYAYDISRLARLEGLANIFVTNGFMTTEALEVIAPFLDAANVDLKSFRDDFYRKVCRARLMPVLESIRFMKKLGIWIEITTLVIAGANDSEEELSDIARFIAEIDRDIPWHISRFHPDYRMLDVGATPLETLRRALAVGKKAGLRYVYLGNVVGEAAETLCPGCSSPVIRRRGFWLERNDLRDGQCPRCGTRIAGVFRERTVSRTPEGQRAQAKGNM
ncbi:MAG: pyruvate formate lyase-activating enzyme 1 [Syntrophaceae bacterium PtaU1.Bin231]|nr:MAG: pyruvate formate lyase-activating enzyme 1 [Syntrophaceae bacterium PtaU1.Bin231]